MYVRDARDEFSEKVGREKVSELVTSSEVSLLKCVMFSQMDLLMCYPVLYMDSPGVVDRSQ